MRYQPPQDVSSEDLARELLERGRASGLKVAETETAPSLLAFLAALIEDSEPLPEWFVNGEDYPP